MWSYYDSNPILPDPSYPGSFKSLITVNGSLGQQPEELKLSIRQGNPLYGETSWCMTLESAPRNVQKIKLHFDDLEQIREFIDRLAESVEDLIEINE